MTFELSQAFNSKDILISREGNIRTKVANPKQGSQIDQESEATNPSHENLIQKINDKLKLVNELITHQADYTNASSIDQVVESNNTSSKVVGNDGFHLEHDKVKKDDHDHGESYKNKIYFRSDDDDLIKKELDNPSGENLKINLIQLYHELKEQKKLLELQYFHLLQQEKDLSTMYEDFNTAEEPVVSMPKEKYDNENEDQDTAQLLGQNIQYIGTTHEESNPSHRSNTRDCLPKFNQLQSDRNESNIINQDQANFPVDPNLKLTKDLTIFKKPYSKSLANYQLTTPSDQVNIDKLQQKIIENQQFIKHYLRSLEKSIELNVTNQSVELLDTKEIHRRLSNNTNDDQSSIGDPKNQRLTPSRPPKLNHLEREEHRSVDYSSPSGRSSPNKLRHSNVNLDESDSDNLTDIALSQIKHRKQIAIHNNDNTSKDLKNDYSELSTGYISSPLTPKRAVRVTTNRSEPSKNELHGHIRNWQTEENLERKGRPNAVGSRYSKGASFSFDIIKDQEDSMLEDVFFVQ
ncbi:uncharacterized protein TRIADDRAFT_52278 [Trichoplax adhaerens]|uniref:Uncharacterized protein n=1 Tax=Trichoplax adhaerens TaxID=10228 RepID=B3RM91_TRIAD|nr:predicted protein [Trichoplax adhaerens]EDV29657.1 predicted protein [Trichoplax adhaerens]|eukprot:XP_002108859.1 predicted protein [Trichoplax adhaerens]